MRTKKEYLELLHKIKWEKGNKIESYLIPAINIEVEESKNESEVGTSKFGGNPDLPIKTEWPIFKDKPMTFLAQINLEQINVFDLDKILPKSGYLYFFIENPDEFSFDHKVIYSNDAELSRRDFPKELNKEYRASEFKMIFENIYTFPSGETLEIESLSLNDQESYMDLYEVEEDFMTYENNQILGHTYPMQGDVKIDWACGNLGVEFSFKTISENQEKIDTLRNDFINLFQFSTENSVPEFWDNFHICSMGYFGIRKQDLKRKEFDKTILTFQNS